MNADGTLAAQTDPFTVANKAIVTALLAWAPLSDCVRAGNRMSTVPRGDAVDAEKAMNIPRVRTSFPGLLVTQGGFRLNPNGNNSRAVDLTQDYLIQWATDVLNVVGLNVVKWETMRALVAAGDTINGATCYGVPFVRGYAVRDAQEGVAVTDETAQRAGWVASFVVTVDMYFDRAAVLAAGL
jgi:hypothetical protein